MSALVPRIEIRPPPPRAATFEADDALGKLVALLLRNGLHSGTLTEEVISSLVAEGRRFAKTDSGRRWTSVLASSKLATNGWLLWNMLDLDRFVTDRDGNPDGDTPAALVEDLLRKVGETQLEQLIRLVSDVAALEATDG